MQTEPAWTFAQLESLLSDWHMIADTKRTAFQSRLKNFHRLGFPPQFEAIKGRATSYCAGQVFDLALAIELTQLGLSPERVVRVLEANRHSVAKAATMACDAVSSVLSGKQSEKDAPRVYVYFDPEALEALTLESDFGHRETDEASITFSCGGTEALLAMLATADSVFLRRLSLVNVTGLVTLFAVKLRPGFVESLKAWAREAEQANEEVDAK